MHILLKTAAKINVSIFEIASGIEICIISAPALAIAAGIRNDLYIVFAE